MSFTPEKQSGALGDLISFEDETRDCMSSVTEIQKLFDPLAQTERIAIDNVASTPGTVQRCPYPPPKPLKPQIPWFLVDKDFTHNEQKMLCETIPVHHAKEESDDIADFLSMFATTVASEVKNTNEQNATKETAPNGLFPGENVMRGSTTCAPAIMRRREYRTSQESAFLSNTYTTMELERFVETVESMYYTVKQHTPVAAMPNGTDSFCFAETISKDNDQTSFLTGSNLHDNWVYNPVFGNLLTQEIKDQTCLGQNRLSSTESNRVEGQIPVHWWHTKTGASKVVHVAPANCKSTEVNAQAPIHWRNTPKWNIPQIEVRITGHWNIRRSKTSVNHPPGADEPHSTPDYAGSKCPLTESKQNGQMHSIPRLSLVCDPNSTFVCELMMEALANIALPPGASMNANDYQLRLHGKAELLHPQARLCDCHQVQLCHRLDMPLRLILEPKRRSNSEAEKAENEDRTREPFIPQSYSVESHCVSPNGDMSTGYTVFQDILEKVRNTIVRNRDKIQTISEVNCLIVALEQSVKAVLATACQTIAFTEVLDALRHVQDCITEAVRVIGVDARSENCKTVSAERQFNATQRNPNAYTNLAFMKPKTISNGDCKQSQSSARNSIVLDQSRNNLEHALHRLELKLLAQIHVFLDWRQIGLRVNPLIMASGSETPDSAPIGQRPQALLLEPDSVAASIFENVAYSSKPKEVRSSTQLMDPFAVDLIAVHRAPRFSQSTTVSSGMNQSRSRSTSPAMAGSSEGNMHYLDSRFYVRLSLIYAGRPLDLICPPDFGSDLASSNPTGSSKSVHSSRDTFYSDAGRTQTILSTFPRVLQFVQSFKFPGFPISCLPRETLLSITLFSYKKGSPESVEGDGSLIGWVNIPIFEANGRLRQNTMVAGLWPPSEAMHEYRLTCSQFNRSSTCPVVQIRFPVYPFDIEYPEISLNSNSTSSPSKGSATHFSQLPSKAKQAVLEAERSIFLQTLNPELSNNSTNQCWISYSEAASASGRAARLGDPHPVLPELPLNAITSRPVVGSGGQSSSSSGAPTSSTNTYPVTTSMDDVNAIALPTPARSPVEVLWNVRSWLTDISSGMVAFLIGILITWPQEVQGDSWSRNSAWSWTRLLQEIYSLLSQSQAPCPGLALRLLAPDVADQGIRHWAVRSLALLPSDILIQYLPQALEAVNHDIYLDYSGLPSLLLFRAATSVRFAYALYWQLNLVIQDETCAYPGSTPLASSNSNLALSSQSPSASTALSVPSVNCAKTHSNANANDSNPYKDWRRRRFLVLKSALLWLAGSRLRASWQRQEQVIDRLYRAALAVKRAKISSSSREEALQNDLRALMFLLNEPPPHSANDAAATNTKQLLPVEPVPQSAPPAPVPLLIQLDDDDDQVSLSKLNDLSVTPTRLNPNSTQQTSDSTEAATIQLEPRQPPSFYDIGFRMPYNPGLLTHRIDFHACTYFTSFTCPLRLVFHAMDTGAEPIMVMFKAGDDLRLDSLITQMNFLMDRIWLDAGLDLRTIHFRIVPTGDRKGLIELISECSTLRQIQEHGGGLTGAFKDSVITTWLQSQNTTELDYKRALDNFLRSLAGSCVMTYVLGVSDRHNDNIMIRYSGHLFHVDFAKVFGNAQKIAGIKRDRVPFVLTQDMLHVVQAYSRELSEATGALTGFGNSPNSTTGRGHGSNSEGVQLFIEYCCAAYNLVRKQSYALLSILEMGLTMDIPGVTRDSVRYVMRALRLDLSEQQASQHFTELIRKALQSKSSSLNFFVHGLAQAKQASSGGGVSGTGTGSPTVTALSPRDSLSRLDSWDIESASDTTGSTVGNGKIRSAAHGNPGQLLSFNPKRFGYSKDVHIEAVKVVRAAVKKKSSDKHVDHYFPMDVWRKNCRVPTRIYRRIADLNEIGQGVQEAYPNSPVLTILPHLLNAVNGGNVTSVKMLDNVQTLVDALLEEDEEVSKSDLVYTFFQSVLFDERFAAEDATLLTVGSPQKAFWAPNSRSYEVEASGDRAGPNAFTPFPTPYVATVGSSPVTATQQATDNLPALQIELCLSESMQQLDLMIKHGRALFIPGSRELPDVYIKVYMMSGKRKKCTKRKTAIIRRSSSPSFNTTFTYELSENDIKKGFLEISAWHAVNLGENFSLGQVYIQLTSLTPGRSITKWYPLKTNWDAV